MVLSLLLLIIYEKFFETIDLMGDLRGVKPPNAEKWAF